MPFIEEAEDSSLEPIAIIGMACRLPGSIDSSSKFWDLIHDQKSVRTPKVPSNRFNIDAHYHPDLTRPGSFSALGGYFLDGNPSDFDPTFFNMTPVEAQWLDPQQRKMLEVSYECLENAGITLDEVAGTNTAVYVASFTSDYQQMSIFERDFRHNYAATGVDVGIISNRINNTFNLNGPSFTINTACSSSVVAIHNACHALRAGDCDAAITGGVNLILIVDQHMNTAKLGVLSPTSECHTFDASADGYGRAEGAGALYLKRLSDAIKDNDVIRGVIRSSAVNTNGKVEGMGITFPNVLGQERVLRHAYKRANLDPNQTAYLECHGTGTPAGDPIEVKAVSNGMNDTRDIDKPLLLGAAKANIGHSEAASGIFATMKAVLSTEKGEIPGVHGFKTLNPNIKDKEWNVKIVEKLTTWPSDFDVRRASVSSFGYGGTNAHLVIESIESICPWYEHGKPKAVATYEYNDITRPFLVTMSAHDDKTLSRNIAVHQKIAGDYYLPDLAYTLNCRRSKFATRGYTIATPGRESSAFEADSFSYGSKLAKPVTLGFVLTGQGAQWARMGYEAMEQFPDFAETIDSLDRILQRIDPRPTWSLRGILEAPLKSSRVSEAEISQPACTAIQIAIIDLFSSWGIEPAVTVGHSSGEIAAAYAAGRICAPEAILAAYFRGFAVAQAAPVGTMLAVGLGADEVEDYIPEEVAEGVSIACENSPSSVTLSGNFDDIAAVKEILDESNVFNRALPTGKAYHSPQMNSVAPLYAELYSKASKLLTETDISWLRPYAGMVSSLTGSEVTASHLPISYWCDNLRNRVLFNSAVQVLGSSKRYADVNILVEIGPHIALGGPVKQICAANGFEKQYIASLVRGRNSAAALLKTAGELYVKGLDVDLELVNNLKKSAPSPVATAMNKKRNAPRYLPDLPPYQWNYETLYWKEPRAMAELRQSKHPRHDILGRRIFGLSTNGSTWKNILRQRDVSWFQDHTLGPDVIFPAAGHLSLAIEALLQQLDLDPQSASGVNFRDIDIQKALLIPDNDEGVEIHTRLQQSAAEWYTFIVESVDNGLWTLHSTGKIQKQIVDMSDTKPSSPHKLSQLHQQVPGKRWYKSFRRVGFQYGSNLQTMHSVRGNGKDRVAAAGVQVQTECGSIDHESRYMLHPSTIDGCLHVVIAAVHKCLHKEMPWGVVPLEIEEMSINFPVDDLDTEGQCMAWTDKAWDRYFNNNVQLFGSSGKCIMDIKNLKLVMYDAAVPTKLTEPRPKEPYRQIVWETASSAQESMQTKLESNSHVAVVHSSSGSAIAGVLAAHTVSLASYVDKFDQIVIDDSDGSTLAALTTASWDSIQKILTSGKPIVWITRGVNEGDSVSGGIPQGFLRAVRSEHISARIALVDADRNVSMEQLASVVQHQLSSVATKDSGDDVEFWLTKDSTVLVSRIDQNNNLNKLFHKEQPEENAAISSEEPYKGKVVDSEIIFEAQPPTPHLASLEAEIQILYAELTKDDLSARASERPRIVAGTIIRTGEDLDKSLKGQAVVAYTKKAFGTRIVTTTFAKVDADQLDVVAATFPHLCKAVDATLREGNATAGDHVLLLPATGPFEDAVSKLGQLLGFRVSKTHGDIAETQRMLLSPGAPNIVIAGSPFALIADVWRLMPRGSKFVFSDVAIGAFLDPRPFTRGVTLSVCGIAEVYENHRPALEQILNVSADILAKSDNLFAKPSPPVLDVEELLNIDDARKRIVETGVNALSFRYEHSQVKSRKVREQVRFSPGNSYLLIGCLGGLGRSLTTWMFERGCRSFIFLSRSGAAKPEAAEVVGQLKQAGASVQVFCADASDEQAVAGIVTEVSSKTPIKGVIHAAMVLQDGLFQTMTLEKYQTALSPKMRGALALHKALGETPLDFFIMTSSLSAVTGNPGQSNYCAGNSYLDFLALYRRKRGLVACSIALPMVEDVGVVAENSDIADSLTRKNPFGIDEREMLVAFEAGIIQGAPSFAGATTPHIGDVQLILGLEPEAMAVAMESIDMSDAYWLHDARLASVREALNAIAAESGAQKDGAGAGFVTTLAGKSESEALDAIGVHIVGRAARILGMQAEQFKLEGASVASHGVDSMIGVELQTWLFKELGLQVGIQVISNPNTTFASLAMMVAEQVGIVT
ncbi:hypothetical protein MMC27_004135 [Xylographa pallens]|nr:hypothetical protein [Xylographa pallens]